MNRVMDKNMLERRYDAIAKVSVAIEQAERDGEIELVEVLSERFVVMELIVKKIEQIKNDYGVLLDIGMILDSKTYGIEVLKEVRVEFDDVGLSETLRNLSDLIELAEEIWSEVSYAMLQETEGSVKRMELMYDKFMWERRIRSLDRMRVDYSLFAMAYTEAVLFMVDLAREFGVVSTVKNRKCEYFDVVRDWISVRFEEDGYRTLEAEASYEDVEKVGYSNELYREPFFLISKRSGIPDVEEFHREVRLD